VSKTFFLKISVNGEERGASDTTEWNETEKGDHVDNEKSEVLKLVSFPVDVAEPEP
jgi:hypothetical protein